jgi:hypothetical protein
MRIVLGIIIGILLTILVAYVADAGRQPVCPAGGAGCPIVNWDEANSRFLKMEAGVRSAWYRLTGHRD